jgi:hypothetical protein
VTRPVTQPIFDDGRLLVVRLHRQVRAPETGQHREAVLYTTAAVNRRRLAGVLKDLAKQLEKRSPDAPEDKS